MRVDRRTFVKASAGLGVAGLVPGLGCEEPTGLGEVTPALLRKRIKTVVVLMLENRSFDHLFGSLSLLEGRDDVDGLRPGMSNPLADGTPVAINPADALCVADPPHSWNGSRTQFSEGTNQGFALAHEARHGTAEAHRAMGYLDRSLQPASYALADQFALCQRWFCSVMGPTWPNRYYSQWATSNGNTGNDLIDDQLPTIYSRLDEAKVPWSSYYGNLPFSAIFPNHSIVSDEYNRLDQFFEDAADGKLRPLVWLDPIYGKADDHPPAHPLAGQVLIASIYEALRSSPQWNECLLIVTYDEHGGFYDHVPPPKGPDDGAAMGFDQRGFRVPALVVGPYVKNAVDSTQLDHTSIVASVLRLHELEPLVTRDKEAKDVLGLLDEEALLRETPRAGEKLPKFEVDDEEIYAEGCVTGLPFHVSPDGAGVTQQPEFEAAFVAKYGANHPKDLRAESTRALALLVERARALGVIAD